MWRQIRDRKTKTKYSIINRVFAPVGKYYPRVCISIYPAGEAIVNPSIENKGFTISISYKPSHSGFWQNTYLPKELVDELIEMLTIIKEM